MLVPIAFANASKASVPQSLRPRCDLAVTIKMTITVQLQRSRHGFKKVAIRSQQGRPSVAVQNQSVPVFKHAQ